MDKITDGMWIAASILIVGMTYTFGVAKPYYLADSCASLVSSIYGTNVENTYFFLNHCIEAGSAAVHVLEVESIINAIENPDPD